MKQVKNSKRVLWASDAKLCQVKMFLAKDCPSKVGLEAQDRPQARTWVSCLKNVHYLNHRSRFEGGCYIDPLKAKLSNIAQIKWKCPPKFVLSCNWHVLAGEESEEAEAEKQREMRVLEAVYPRVSDIPHSPSFPMDSQEYHLDDSYIPLIPITPIEEEEGAGAVDLPSDIAPRQNASLEAQTQALPQDLLSTNADATQCDPQPCINLSANEKPAPEMLPGSQVDVGVAIVAAITAIMKSAEQGSLIDTNLLIKLLSDPKMIEKLISEQATPDDAKSEPSYGSIPSLVAGSKDGILTDTRSTSTSGSNLITPSVTVSPLRPDLVIKKLANELGAAANIGVPSVTPSMALPWANTDPVIEKLVQKYGETIDKGVAPPGSYPLSSPKPSPFIDKLIQKHTALADTAVAAPVSGSYPMTSTVALPNPRSVPVVKKLIHECGFPNNAGSAPFYAGKQPAPPAFFLPSLKQEEINIKRTIDVYGKLEYKGNDPISRSMSLSNMDVILGANMNSPRLSNMGDTALRFQGPSPDHARPYLSTLHHLVHPSSQAKTFLPGSATISSFSAISAAPSVKDTNYIRSLIRQHGDMHETKDSCLSQSGKFNVQLHDPEMVPNLIPNELTPRVPKSCIYFNSPSGCRNGSNCLYRHDVPRSLQPGSVMEGPAAKRMKIGEEIIGRT